MERIADFFRWLNDARGINFSIFYDALDRARFLEGLWTTIELSLICTGLSLVIGVVGAWLQGSGLGVVRKAVQAYIQFFRNTPPLVQLFFFYFAVGNELPHVLDAHGMLVPPIGNSAGRFCRFSSSLGRSTSRSSARASRRCRAPWSRPRNPLGTVGLASIGTCCCRCPSASACQRSITTWSIS